MKDFREMLERKEEDAIMFHTLTAGKYTVSIQASEYHYCKPRVTGLPAKNYYFWECAVWPADDESKPWCSPWKNKTLFKGLGLQAYWEQGEVSVGAYIPTEKIQALLDRLEES